MRACTKASLQSGSYIMIGSYGQPTLYLHETVHTLENMYFLLWHAQNLSKGSSSIYVLAGRLNTEIDFRSKYTKTYLYFHEMFQ